MTVTAPMMEVKNRKLGNETSPAPIPMIAVTPTRNMNAEVNISLSRKPVSRYGQKAMLRHRNAPLLIARPAATAISRRKSGRWNRTRYSAPRPRNSVNMRTEMGNRFMRSSQRTVSVSPTAELQRIIKMEDFSYSI